MKAEHPTQATTVTATAPPATGKAVRKAVLATAIGSFLEYYDYFVYGALASVIAQVFFPPTDEVAGLLATFAIFGVAFVARPAGAVFFGHIGDRMGRKNAFALSVLLMAVATLAIGLAPSYAAAGATASVWLAVARLAQGFSTGGEFGGATAYLIELAPPNRRGLYGCVQAFTAGLGVMGGVGMGTLVTSALSEDALLSWGWRVPFLAAAPLALLGVFIRRRLVDSEEFHRSAEEGELVGVPLVETLRHHWRPMLTSVGVVLAWTISAYVFVVYAPTYLTTVGGLSLSAALTTAMVGVAVWVVSIPAMAYLSDRIGRRPVICGGALGLAVWTWPAFELMSSGERAAALLGLVPAMVALGAASGPVGAILAEQFPTRIRYTAVGLGFGLCSALFGGTAPYLATWWTAELDAQWLLTAYLVVAALITLVVAALTLRRGHVSELPS